jgi:hypothetical protein
MSARITVRRTHAEDVRQRQVIVRVDDGDKATLMFGDVFSRELAPGEHHLRVHNTLFRKTIPFSIAENEHAEFDVINRAGPVTMSFLALMGAAPLYLSVARR